MWEFNKTRIIGYGKLFDPNGKEFNVNFDTKGNIIVTTIKQNKVVKIPKKVEKLIKEKIMGE